MQSVTEAGRSDRPIRVLEVIGNASKGGMENYIKNFIAHLPAHQFQITCICPYESPFTAALRQLGVEGVYITPIADDPPWRSIQLTMEVARLHHIDVLHAHMPKAHVLAGVAGCIIHKPVVATVHGMHVTAHELGVTRAVGSHLTMNCQEAYAQALALGVPAERVTLIGNGVDTLLFTPDNKSTKLRNAIGVPEGTPLVGFVGRLEHEKGPDLFLRAAEYVHSLRPDVHFVVIGDGAMRKQLIAQCANFRIQRRVHFVGWWTNTADIYPALDLLVHTSRSDGTSLVLLEAMSCACPVVAIAVGGVPEIVENEGTGLLAPPDDWWGVGMRILELLEQPERLKNMSTAARKRVIESFNVETNTQRTGEVLRRVAIHGANGHAFTNGNKPDNRVSLNNGAALKAK